MFSLANVAAAKILSVDESQSQLVFYKAGTYYVKLPKHVTTFWVDAAAAGGGGSGGSPTGGGGAGGGGGCFCRAFPIALPAFATTLCIVVGKGGTGGLTGTPPTLGTNGENTAIYAKDINSTTMLRLAGGFAASILPSAGVGGKANYSNSTYAYTPPAGSTGNTVGAAGEPAVWRDYVKSIVVTGNILSGSTGGNGGSWDGISTSTGGNGGMSGVSYIASGAVVGSTGGIGYAGGGGGGMSFGMDTGTDGSQGIVPTPTNVSEAPSAPGNGGHGGCTNKPGTDGADGFIRIYW